jgi:hypothetical protein
LIAINYIQYELLHSRGGGLSLDGMLAGFQITNLRSLWSRGLWNNSLKQDYRARRLQFTLIIVALGVLASIAGPSSAILMLPSTGWWTIPYRVMPYDLPSGLDSPRLHHFTSAMESVLWPAHITLNNFMPPDCTFVNASTPQDCPADGFSKILVQAATDWADGWNITMPTSMEDEKFNGQRSFGTIYNRILEGNAGTSNERTNFVLSWTRTTAAVGNMLQSAWDESNFADTNNFQQEIKFELSIKRHFTSRASSLFDL